MKNVIEIQNLNKSFGQVKAVQDLSFKVKEGELFAFLGVNGAGKSTTISIMCGTLEKDSGSVLVCGENIDKDSTLVKSKLGVVFQSSVLDSPLSVYDNLKSRASLYGIVNYEFEKKLDELTELLDFRDILKRPLSKLSGGQKRKIDIARALLHNPQILVLDEPTTGLDPQTRATMWSVINKLRKEKNMTVFLTTHYMEEAADADYVVIIDGGKMVAQGSPLELKNKYTSDHVTVYGIDDKTADSLGVKYEKIAGAHRFKVEDISQVTELIINHPQVFKDYEVTKGKMDSVFLNVTGKSLEKDSE